MISEVFLDYKYTSFYVFFSKIKKKGRHAFRLRHAQRIEGRTSRNRAQAGQKSFENRARKTSRPEVVKKLFFNPFCEPVWSKKVRQNH